MASQLLGDKLMALISLLPSLVRENLGTAAVVRQPEPDLVMESAEQVEAFAHAGRIDGVMAASYLFQTAQITEVIAGSKLVVELGCGPATQLAQVASVNPDIEFLGIDLSVGMLENAEKHVADLGLSNVRFAHGDMTRLDFIPDHSVDAVVSTLALHHLPTLGDLEKTFREIARILKPGGAVYLVDFALLKSLRTIEFFAYKNAAEQPECFTTDYYHSLLAAFSVEDFRTLASAILPMDVGHYTTSGIQLLQIVKSKPAPLSLERRKQFAAMRDALPKQYVGDLDDMRLFFRLGGLENDPFKVERSERRRAVAAAALET